MNVISNSHDLDWQIAQLLLDQVVGVTTRSGDVFDLLVEEVNPDGFVTLVGPRVMFDDDFLGGNPRRHERREVTLIDIDTLEVY